MKVAILAGGGGTRLSEETSVKPKPMVEIGGKPILWHIMKIYSAFGFNEFVIALGYKGEIIKDYFTNYRARSSSLTISLSTGEVTIRDSGTENWTVHLLDTGLNTNTGGRVRKISEFIGDETFMLTYGDGVADVNIEKLLAFHRENGKLATVTAVRPPARFGSIEIKDNLVAHFAEKPQVGEGWINGGYYVLEAAAARLADNDLTLWEAQPMEQLARSKQLAAYQHQTFWQCMDTTRDLMTLESLWSSGARPWKIW